MAQSPTTPLGGADGNRLAGDPTALRKLGRQAGSDPKAATRQAAQQFEALFMQQVLKGMRASTMPSGMFDNAGGDMAKSMLDDQMAKAMSGRRGGLADVLERQLNRQMAAAEKAKAATAAGAGAAANNNAGLALKPAGEAQAFSLAPQNRSLALDAGKASAARLRALVPTADAPAPAASRAPWADGTAAAGQGGGVPSASAQAVMAQALAARAVLDSADAEAGLATRVTDGVESLLQQLEAAHWSQPAASGDEAGGARIVERPADVATVVGTPRGRTEGIPQKGAAGFIERHSAAAAEVAASSGIPAQFMISQAALETGWGRKEILRADGSPSHNLFGIKADANWKGPTADVTTTEYVNGKPQRVTARFRAYGSYEESFADYAKLLTTSPRYQQAVQQARAGNWNGATASARGAAAAAEGFAVGLQKAGYATDPAYATKLAGVINTTLRLQRAMG